MSTGLTVHGLQGMITGNDFFLLLEPTILDKNVKNNARYMFNLRILPSKARFTQDTLPSEKNNVEVWPEHFCCLLNNTREGWGKGSPWCQIHRVGLLCVRKSKILNTFCPRLYLIHFDG